MTTIELERLDGAAHRAARDAAPFAIALIPFGMAIGGASAEAGFSAWESVFGAVALLAGASQLAAIEIIGNGGGIAATAMVVALINLRLVLYGAGVARWFAAAPLRHRLLLVVPVVDQTFLLCQQRFAGRTELPWRRRYYLTATLMLASAFVGSQVIAFQIGGTLPDSLGLDLAAPLAFAGMLAKAVSARRDVVAGLVAALVVVLGTAAIGTVALPIGVAAGVGSALRTDRSRR
ncbi:AzlC family ABC transporter permease [Ilumatobacter sp.]|uniref:AzlC family ABC transporter permease n=1 Tax=Ilumatobacter sp. TaxID=1967498 RepID=UPI003C3E748E